VQVGSSSGDIRLTGTLVLHGEERIATAGRVLTTPVTVH
jgi:hypothetical protein